MPITRAEIRDVLGTWTYVEIHDSEPFERNFRKLRVLRPGEDPEQLFAEGKYIITKAVEVNGIPTWVTDAP